MSVNKAKRRQARADAAKLRSANQKMAQLMISMYKNWDQAIEKERVLQHEITKHVKCKVGCAHCCKQLVLITLPEAALIIQKYPYQVARALPMLEAHRTELLDMGIADVPLGEFSKDHGIAVQWRRRDKACPFLSSSNRCTIYDARPIACRSFHYIGPEPVVCSEIEAPWEDPVISPHWEPPSTPQAVQKVAELMQAFTDSVIFGALQDLVFRLWVEQRPGDKL